MKKINRILITVFLFIFVVLSACGCAELPEKEIVPETNNVVTLTENEAVSFDGYNIVRADGSGAVIKGAATVLNKNIKSVCGTNVKVTTDFNGATEKEILLGNTKRLSDHSLRLGSFKIVREGERIAILGGSDEAVLDGVNYFIDNCMTQNGFICGDGYVYYGGKEYSVTAVTVDGKVSQTLNVKCEIANEDYSKRIADAIEEFVGISSEVTQDNSKTGVIFTDQMEKFRLKIGEWAVAVDDGIIYLVAEDEFCQKAVIDCFISLLRDTNGTLKLKKGINQSGKIETREEYYQKKQLVIYPELPTQIRRNFEYKVTVTQGKQTHQIPVYDHTMEYDPIDCGIGGDYHRRFSQFAFAGDQVRVDIKVGLDFGTYSVFPSAKKFKSEFKDGVISVYLDKPDYFGIRLDNDDNTILSVFADYPEYPLETPKKDDPDVIYIEGWHEPEGGLMDVKLSNTVLYIAPGAVLNARVKVFSSASYSKVIGRGVILDPFSDIYNYDIRNGGTEGSGRCLCSMGAKGSVFDGPVLMDARCFNIATGSSDVVVRNYKALSSMMTTDGITASSTNSLYEHCWIYCGDNALVISWAQDQSYRDITIGTTCSAMFPQGSTTNIELDGIYVFRANGGIINNVYNNKNDTTASVTVKNVDCIDATTFTHFFGGRNMGVLGKVFNFINVNLPSITGEQNLHMTNGMSRSNLLVNMQNYEGILSTENYTLNFTNLYINGAAIRSASRAFIINNWDNEITFSNDGTFKPVKQHRERVRYKAPVKIYVGALQIAFEYDVISENGRILVPADEIVRAVRSNDVAKTVDVNGIKYISSDDIAMLDTVESVNQSNGSLYIKLENPKGNLILVDEGEISQIAESTCYTVDLVVKQEGDETVYTCYSHGKGYTNGGMSMIITDEIKAYGAGEYTISFMARASVNGNMRFGFTMDDAMYYSKDYMNAVFTPEWQEFTYTMNVTEKMLNDAKLFTIRIEGARVDQIESFSFKGLSLIKN